MGSQGLFKYCHLMNVEFFCFYRLISSLHTWIHHLWGPPAIRLRNTTIFYQTHSTSCPINDFLGLLYSRVRNLYQIRWIRVGSWEYQQSVGRARLVLFLKNEVVIFFYSTLDTRMGLSIQRKNPTPLGGSRKFLGCHSGLPRSWVFCT